MDRALTLPMTPTLPRRAALALPLLLALPRLAWAEGPPPLSLGDLPEAPAEWLGPDPHLVLRGTLDGRPVGAATRGLGEGPEAQSLHALRHFAPRHDPRPDPGGAGWRVSALSVLFQARAAGSTLDLTLVLAQDDFARRAAEGPWAYDLVAEEAPEGARASLLLAAGFAGPGQFGDSVGAFGWEGTLSLALDDGARDAGAPPLDGRIGGFLAARRGADRVAASFTAPVTGWAQEP